MGLLLGRETAGVTALDELSVLFRYPPSSAFALLEYFVFKVLVLLGLRVGFLPGSCSLLVGSLILSLMEVRRLAWFRVEPGVRACVPCFHDGAEVQVANEFD